ncbi:MAG: lipase family protein [Solirubrobacteraceae bacterium]|nr:lipase family protein [Solirubrobacteraceae bacterium]
MPRSSRPVVGSAVAAGLLALVAAPSAFASAAFYTPPSSLPSANGALVKTEPQGLNATPGKATRIMYKSTDSTGSPVAVIGTYIEPTAKYAGSGPRPLIAYAEGTQGQGDSCAPSKSLESGYLGGTIGGVSIGYEIPNINGLLEKGVAVVVTDYVGLGTTNRVHTYVNRLDQGRAVLDAARAASKVSGASVTSSSPVGAYGYSQGGGAAASAAELQPTYAPELNLKGAFAGAPPADLGATMTKADGTILTAVIGYAINGFVESYPSLRTILDRETNQAGKDALKQISTQCTADSIFSFATKKTSTWTTSGKSITEVVAGIPEAQAIIDEQRIGKLKPKVPVRIVTGTQDDIVPHGQAKQLAKDWCSKGVTVNYTPVIQAFGTNGTAVNHLQPMIAENGNSQKWILDRLAGIGAGSNCFALPVLP